MLRTTNSTNIAITNIALNVIITSMKTNSPTNVLMTSLKEEMSVINVWKFIN